MAVQSGFREALRKLASDTAYREKVVANPKSILNDFQLTFQDVKALREAAVLSGADVSEVDKLMANKGIESYSNTKPMVMDNGCCCCCCCCGETGVDVVFEFPPTIN